MHNQPFCKLSSTALIKKLAIIVMPIYVLIISVTFIYSNPESTLLSYLFSLEHFGIVHVVTLPILITYIIEKKCVTFNEDGIIITIDSFFRSKKHIFQFEDIELMTYKLGVLSLRTKDRKIAVLESFSFKHDEFNNLLEILKYRLNSDIINPTPSKKEIVVIFFFLAILILLYTFIFRVLY